MCHNEMEDVKLTKKLEKQIRTKEFFYENGIPRRCIDMFTLVITSFTRTKGGGDENSIFQARANMGFEAPSENPTKPNRQYDNYNMSGYAKIDGENVQIKGNITIQKI